MGMTIKQFPARDAGTGEHSQAEEPVTYTADDVKNQPAEGAEDLPAEATFTADDVDNKPAEGGVDVEPVTVTADWPSGDDKVVKAENTDTKTTDEKPAKRTAKKGS